MAPARRAWRWLARHPWVTSLVMVAAFALAAGLRDVQRTEDQARYDRCVSGWAGELSARFSALSSASDDLWRTFADLLAHPRPDARETFQGHLDQYVATSDANPAPVPPALRCGR